MTTNDVIANSLARNLEFVKMTLADFSDADLHVRTCPGANSAYWQLGHLVVAEKRLVANFKPDAHPPLPSEYEQKFSKEASRADDAANPVSKEELLAQFNRMREATIAWVRGMTPEQLAQETPEKMRRFAPNAAEFAVAMAVHVGMHLGQFQALRRKLGKPVLF